MFANLNLEKIPSVMETLNKMKENGSINFYLTGSRLWKINPEEKTDWDFFVKLDFNVYRFLEDLDFLEISQSGYTEIDPSVAAVYRKGFQNGEQIDVQVICIDWVDRKIQANAVFKQFAPQVGFMMKDDWKLWWRAMLSSLPPPPPPPLEHYPPVPDFKGSLDLLASHKINAIRALREKYGLGLCEAKDRMDMLTEGKISNERLGNYKRIPF